MRIISYLILIIIIALGLSFALLNADPVTLNYYFGIGKISLSLLLVICLGIGAVLGLLVASVPLFRLKKSNYQLKSQLKRLQKDIGISNNNISANHS